MGSVFVDGPDISAGFFAGLSGAVDGDHRVQDRIGGLFANPDAHLPADPGSVCAGSQFGLRGLPDQQRHRFAGLDRHCPASGDPRRLQHGLPDEQEGLG